MKIKSLKTYVFIIIGIFIFSLTVVYAALNIELKINGSGNLESMNWKVYFSNLELNKINGKARVLNEPEISSDGVQINNFNVNLSQPNDEVIYNVDIVNEGNINAEIDEIKTINLTEELQRFLEFKVEYIDGTPVKNGDVLEARKQKSAKIVIKYKDIDDAKDLAKETDINMSLTINYIQTDKTDNIGAENIKEEPKSADIYPGDITDNGTRAGTEVDPYVISSVEDLVTFSNDVANASTYENKYISLGCDLDFDETASYSNYKTKEYGDINGDNQVSGLMEELTSNSGFIPIGTETNFFKGIFDGNNYSISNLYINRSDTNYVGLFSKISNTLKNLTITNADITGADYSGFIGFLSGTISNVNINNTKVVGNNNVGIAAGTLNYGTIKETKVSDGNVTGVSSVGGLTGFIFSSYFASGYAHILSSLVSANVTGTKNVGGIVGNSDASYSSNEIKAIYLGGNIIGTSNVNRIVGGGNTNKNTSYAVQSKSYVGTNENNLALLNNSDNYSVKGMDIDSLDEVLQDINMADMVYDTYIGGDNDNDGYVWDYNDDETKVVKMAYDSTITMSGAGTNNNPYIVTNYEELKQASSKLSSYIKLGNDIDLTGKKHYMLGNDLNKFSGNFDGQEHTISNLNLNLPNFSNVGFIGYLTGTIANLNIDNAKVLGNKNVGSAVGHLHFGNIKETKVSNCNINGTDSVGGLVGYMYSTTGNGYSHILSSLVSANVTGTKNVGGIVGNSDTYATSNEIKSIYLGGNIIGTSNVNRIVGRGDSGKNTSYAVQSKSYVGTNENNLALLNNSDNYSVKGMDIDSLDDVLQDINMADMVYDTYIGGDNDNDGYVWDYNEDETKVVKMAYDSTITMSGAGTNNNPYIVTNYEELKQASSKLSSYIKLGNDIDLTGKKYYMLGNYVNKFSGNFDGQEHTISNLNLNIPRLTGVGFIGFLTGTISNINIDNAKALGNKNVGSAVGRSYYGVIKETKVYDSEVKGIDSVGGLVGYIYSSSGNGSSRILSSLVSANVTGTKNVGGIVGNSDVSYTSNEIKSIYLGGNIIGTSNVNRIVGGGNTGKSTSYAVQNKSYIGTNKDNLALLNNGDNYSVKGMDIDSLDEVLQDINMADMVYDTYIAGDNDNDGYVWDYNEDETKVVKMAYDSTITMSGAGTKNDPYIVTNYEELKQASSKLSSYIKLGNDIDLTGKKHYMLGNDLNKFSGNFDGQEHTINNLNLNLTNFSNIGFIGYSTGMISNLNIDNAKVVGNNNVGSVAGYSTSSIKNVSTKSNVYGNKYIGGIVGYIKNTIDCSDSITKISGNEYVGGIVGYSTSIISNVKIDSNVIGNSYYGGLAGYCDKTNYVLVKAEVNYSGTAGNYAGCIAGRANSGIGICTSGHINGTSNTNRIFGTSDGTTKKVYAAANNVYVNSSLVQYDNENTKIGKDLTDEELSLESTYHDLGFVFQTTTIGDTYWTFDDGLMNINILK